MSCAARFAIVGRNRAACQCFSRDRYSALFSMEGRFAKVRDALFPRCFCCRQGTPNSGRVRSTCTEADLMTGEGWYHYRHPPRCPCWAMNLLAVVIRPPQIAPAGTFASGNGAQRDRVRRVPARPSSRFLFAFGLRSRDALAAPGWLSDCYKDDPWHQGGDATIVQFKITDRKRLLLQQPVMETFWMAAGMALE